MDASLTLELEILDKGRYAGGGGPRTSLISAVQQSHRPFLEGGQGESEDWSGYGTQNFTYCCNTPQIKTVFNS
jgi:hypothetical protein